MTDTPDEIAVSTDVGALHGLTSHLDAVAELAGVLTHALDGRCRHCWRPAATDADWEGTVEGERPDLCWDPDGGCTWDFQIDPDILRAAAVYEHLNATTPPTPPPPPAPPTPGPRP